MSAPQIPADIGREAVVVDPEREAAAKRAQAWERSMRRTFKGIKTPAARRFDLGRALAKEEAANGA